VHLGYDKIAIPISGHADAWLVLSCARGEFDSSPKDCSEVSTDTSNQWLGRSSESPTFKIVEDNGKSLIRLIETKSYQWAIQGDVKISEVSSTLCENRRQRWNVRRRNAQIDSGEFCVVNHLGFASFKLIGSDEEILLDLPLEFVSKKIDFDSEYRSMTEDIAAFCEQLLLSWNAPTSLRFSSNPETERKLLLEQFLFLRHFLNDERLGLLLEAISRHPHSVLIKQHQWKPSGTARSADYLSSPTQTLRSWQRKDGRLIPGEVLDVHKEDIHDTPPNQFIKFALNSFRQICMEVTELLPESTPAREATELIKSLDALLARRFFREVSPMRRLPLDNQTLQKREGYREILRAWILTQAATTLDWQGNEDCYQGETRDVATLYEYWIFLQIHQILEDIEGIERIDGASIHGDNPAEFISEKDGQITINLTSGKNSRSTFLLTKNSESLLRIELHYEKTFSKNASATSGGSYSRQFRPDYTLSIYPARYPSEKKAEQAGKIAHLHFDAKYRASNLKEVFGQDDDSQITQEKNENKTQSTYKRGDLLKMHTYNDALRKTVGSYVLYPSDGETNPERLSKFHEIAPGVGALVLKPGQPACITALKGFLSDIFTHQSNQFSQYRYLSDTSHSIVENSPDNSLREGEAEYHIARTNAPCVLLWVKPDQEEEFRKYGFAYCRAIPEDETKEINLDLSIQVGSEFIPIGGRSHKLETKGWRAKTAAARFLTKDKLKLWIKEQHPECTICPSSETQHYILFEFTEATSFKKMDVTEVHKKHRSGKSIYMAVSCSWDDVISMNKT